MLLGRTCITRNLSLLGYRIAQTLMIPNAGYGYQRSLSWRAIRSQAPGSEIEHYGLFPRLILVQNSYYDYELLRRKRKPSPIEITCGLDDLPRYSINAFVPAVPSPPTNCDTGEQTCFSIHRKAFQRTFAHVRIRMRVHGFIEILASIKSYSPEKEAYRGLYHNLSRSSKTFQVRTTITNACPASYCS